MDMKRIVLCCDGTWNRADQEVAGKPCPTNVIKIAYRLCKRDPDGIVRMSRETKGRGGKAVTVVRGLPLAADALDTLGKQLKAACGSGGAVKDGVVEVQGDHCDKVMALLQAQGYKVKRAGG